jgi:hypothetical protein
MHRYAQTTNKDSLLRGDEARSPQAPDMHGHSLQVQHLQALRAKLSGFPDDVVERGWIRSNVPGALTTAWAKTAEAAAAAQLDNNSSNSHSQACYLAASTSVES